MNENEARDIADIGFTHIASDPDMTGDLLAQAGADVSAIREMASRPDFAVFVLEFLLEYDERILGFATASGIKPERVQMARAVLGGFDPF